MLSSELRVLDWDEAAHWCETWRRTDKRIGFTNGCFDVLHIGHATLLDYTMDKCDRLIVGLNSDASVRRLKGNGRPINNQRDRAAMLALFNAVDAVVIFDTDTPLNLIKMIEPDAMFKGADYGVSQIIGADIVKQRGGKVYRCPLVEGHSSTKVIKMVRK